LSYSSNRRKIIVVITVTPYFVIHILLVAKQNLLTKRFSGLVLDILPVRTLPRACSGHGMPPSPDPVRRRERLGGHPRGGGTSIHGPCADAAHWTIRAELDGMDDDRPARIRETTTRDGASLVTLKEVDFLDEPGEQWFSRNRSVLERRTIPE